MKKHLSLHERIRNADASISVENLKAQHAYYHARADAATEWTQIWTRSDDCGWGHVFGCLVGFDQAWYALVTDYYMLAVDKWMETVKKYPEIGGKEPLSLMETAVHTLVTDVIEVADDGMSARGSFVTPGVIHSVLNPDEAKYCLVLWERYGSDFVFEDGEWKYLNEQVCPDIGTALDAANWGEVEYQRLVSPEPPESPGFMRTPDHLTLPPSHKFYSLLQTPQDTVPWPEPYGSMTAELRYNRPTEKPFLQGDDHD